MTKIRKILKVGPLDPSFSELQSSSRRSLTLKKDGKQNCEPYTWVIDYLKYISLLSHEKIVTLVDRRVFQRPLSLVFCLYLVGFTGSGYNRLKGYRLQC